jgi:2-amino-4-hydroxy-6-hydroxymethyldihydropteridine diphosphokinase
VKPNAHREVAYIGLGSNLNNPERNVNDALKDISDLQHVQLIAASSLYQSAPVGVVDQPEFINAVCKVSVDIGPASLLRYLLNIEAKLGRIRTIRNGPRIIDLDVLLFGQLRYESSDICIPHPRMFSRAFVLKPLLEIAPELEAAKNFRSMVSKEILSDPTVFKL